MSKINGDPAETFDYVIVGAGAAGSILANRLSEDRKTMSACWKPDRADWHPFLHIPAGFIKVLFDPAFTWQFSSEPTDNTKGRRIPIPQGRTLGGSTAINGLAYNRGQPGGLRRVGGRRKQRAGGMPTCCPTSSAPSARSAGETTPTVGERANKPSRTWTGSTRSAKRSSPGRRGKASPATQTTTEPPKRGSATTSARS